jgi:integrase
VGSVTLQAARETARLWLSQITEGKDPRAVQEATAKAESKAKGSAFVEVAEMFISERMSDKRSGMEVARAIRREFGGIVDGKPSGPWKDKNVGEIEPSDVADIIRTVAKRAPHQARNILGYVSRVFDWAVATGKIKYSPCASIKPKTLLGSNGSRKRTLNDIELRKVWHGVESIGYPFAPLYRLLILTGLRLNEVADANENEIDLKKRIWIIPASRMKSGLDHVVPLCSSTVALLKPLPKWTAGNFIFTTTSGAKPVHVSDKVKKKINKIVGFSNWRNHDLRRTVRTHLSRLPIEEHVRELMLAHTRKGIAGVYDQYAYLKEKKAGFDLWHAQLKKITKAKLN